MGEPSNPASNGAQIMSDDEEVTEAMARGWRVLSDFADDEEAQRKFWGFVLKRGPDDCWPWTGSAGPRGYGMMAYRGGTRRASRLAWALAHRRSPEHLYVCHTCDNPSCVNPAHLFAGTARDNVQDMMAKGRHVRPARDEALVGRLRGESSNFAKIRREDVFAIRRRRADGEALASIAGDFGLAPNSVGDIVAGRTWAHV